jgi:hypothetical protein
MVCRARRAELVPERGQGLCLTFRFVNGGLGSQLGQGIRQRAKLWW